MTLSDSDIDQHEAKLPLHDKPTLVASTNSSDPISDHGSQEGKLEDGVLVVTVPKVEKEWTDVKRVDIQ